MNQLCERVFYLVELYLAFSCLFCHFSKIWMSDCLFVMIFLSLRALTNYSQVKVIPR